ncbi:MAG: hypothetical protein RSG48_06995 [Clostridia bacterium]
MRKKMISIVTIVVLILSLACTSYATSDNTIEPMSNRYYNITEKDSTVTKSIPMTSDSPNVPDTVWVGIGLVVARYNVIAGLTEEVISFGTYLYNYSYDGELIVGKSVYKTYQVDRLTGERTYLKNQSYEKIRLTGYAFRSGSWEIVRNFSHTLYYK